MSPSTTFTVKQFCRARHVLLYGDVGEGFAFFAWHRVMWPGSRCNSHTRRAGIDCYRWWRERT